MKRLYLIIFDAGLPRKELTDVFVSDAHFGAWFFSIDNSVFVYSSIDHEAIHKLIQEKWGGKSRHFITEVRIETCQGWMPGKHWDVIHQKGAEKKFEVQFQGYYLESKDLPAVSGVYCVYRCVYSKDKDSVMLKKVIYVGQAKNIHDRHLEHEKRQEWEGECRPGEQLCFSYAPVLDPDLLWCEAALIYSIKPDCNDKGKESFDYDDTYLVTSGENRFLPTDIVIERSVSNGER